MSIRVALYHRTHYRYAKPVMLTPHVVRLRPAPHCRTPITSYSLHIEPAEHFINWQQDIQGNHQARLVFPEAARELSFTIDLVAELSPINPFDFFVESGAERYPFTYAPDLAAELAPYLKFTKHGKRFNALVAEMRATSDQIVDYLVSVNNRIKELVTYLIRLEPGIQTPDETLTSGRGSCRDSAWLQVQVLRHLGIAARFASGYLIQLAADEKPLEGPSGPETDFTDLHAWCEAYVPGAGWIGLDATSGLLAGEGHLPLACTADPTNAAPITGGFNPIDGKPVESDFEVEMRVERLYEAPRPTRPYKDSTWQVIDKAGQAVDKVLVEEDLELTMGGEPTFVALDDMDGDEWNVAALGPSKRRRAEALLGRLASRFATGAMLHHGQGKWYPGEPLPRWALSCYWRKDGVPVWRDDRLLAGGRPPQDHTYEDAARFIGTLAGKLGIEHDTVTPAFEDVYYLALREQRIPVNIDPTTFKRDDPESREAFYRVMQSEPGQPTGYILPLRRTGDTWTTGPWILRVGHCFLLPGDSPMGFRLPLDSLPYVENPYIEPERDPFDPDRGELAVPGPLPEMVVASKKSGPWSQIFQQQQQRDRRRKRTGQQEPAFGDYTGDVIRTALCVEPRNGHLHVFMPPVSLLEDYLALISTVEETAAECGLPVIIEGYHPPRDPRLTMLQVTPDPGVIEVNMQPAHSWNELREILTGLYSDARHCGLGTEKYQLDGRIAGTGGGNHITLGGPEPALSPFLRKPAILRSLIAFWINHPCLSYLFSGQFIGPTSQAPRADEARHESVTELELALREIDQLGDEAPYWLIDRILRHILIDVTGNTHRTEICIDKLFSPDHGAGRLGLVELRGFEMPPHPQMGLAQALLVRALVASFARQPYRQQLVRWGTQLHDRFLLPSFLWQDLRSVCRYLDEQGFDVRAEWFEPHMHFRCPEVGRINHEGAELILRNALEPWPTLGEEPAGGGTTRFVDSSLERLEVLITGLGERYQVTCNGVALPLQKTGIAGQLVAGVRFRAWLPATCLHPTIGPDEPLVFDLVDRELQRAVAGCTYWATHPGGRNFETRPVNANEASGRCQARFSPHGHTPGPVQVIACPHNGDYPCTLDLRLVDRES